MSADISGWRKPVRTITEDNDQTGSVDANNVVIDAAETAEPQPESTSGIERSSTIDAQAAKEHPEVADAVAKIKGLRQTIDNIDGAVIHLLAERFKATSQVGVLKAGAGFAPADYKREDYQIERLQRIAKDAGLDPNIAEMYREFVVTEAKKRHKRIADAGGDPGVLDVFA
ncbi:chorismate mutase [Bifidobacterium vansinderenii]|uniref:Chorismate mutase n=1 Tax=Bifidobacterium vansinderenii TaxID=1984871 RepID=A0A229VYI9_9BIFI|nr:chorismate mutase [Bifidobacterium vansinderenii]